MRTLELPDDYALVLQQLNEDGSDDFNTLVEALNFDKNRLKHIVSALQHKGLVAMDTSRQKRGWLSLSRKGKRLLSYIWPESTIHYGY